MMNRRALRVLGLLLTPLLAFALGLRMMDAETGWPAASDQLQRKVVLAPTDSCVDQLKPALQPIRWVASIDVQLQPGWSSADLCRLHSQLEDIEIAGKSGLEIYRDRLRADRIFVLVYGLALLFCMWRLGVLMQIEAVKKVDSGASVADKGRGGSGGSDADKSKEAETTGALVKPQSGLRYWQLGFLLPLLCMACDWLEDKLLLDLWQALSIGDAAPADVGLASLATFAKLALFLGSASLIWIYGMWAAPELKQRLLYELATARRSPFSWLLDALNLALMTACWLIAGCVLTYQFLKGATSNQAEFAQSVGLSWLVEALSNLGTVVLWQLEYVAILAVLSAIVGIVFAGLRFSFARSWAIALVSLFLLISAHRVFLELLDPPDELGKVLPWQLGILAWVLLARIRLVRPGSKKRQDAEPRNVVICIDGTWNYPGQPGGNTNVFKLWDSLEGERIGHSRRNSANRTKKAGTEIDDEGRPLLEQVSRYYRGVGNQLDNQRLGRIVGGAFGMGADALTDRAYTDLVYNYRAEDRVFLFGFSRGAAICRLLAGRIVREQIPRWMVTFRWFGILHKVKVSQESLPCHVEFMGIWDTVAAFGVPKDVGGIPFQKINLGKDLTVDSRVERVVHMVALDEQRDAFQPTLVEADVTDGSDSTRIEERWFAGCHADVGGGNADDRLANITLEFLRRRLPPKLRFAADPPDTSGAEAAPIHQAESPLYGMLPRELPVDAAIDPSVTAKIGLGTDYRPPSLEGWHAEKLQRQAKEQVWQEIQQTLEPEPVATASSQSEQPKSAQSSLNE